MLSKKHHFKEGAVLRLPSNLLVATQSRRACILPECGIMNSKCIYLQTKRPQQVVGINC